MWWWWGVAGGNALKKGGGGERSLQAGVTTQARSVVWWWWRGNRLVAGGLMGCGGCWGGWGLAKEGANEGLCPSRRGVQQGAFQSLFLSCIRTQPFLTEGVDSGWDHFSRTRSTEPSWVGRGGLGEGDGGYGG